MHILRTKQKVRIFQLFYEYFASASSKVFNYHESSRCFLSKSPASQTETKMKFWNFPFSIEKSVQIEIVDAKGINIQKFYFQSLSLWDCVAWGMFGNYFWLN